MDIDKLQNDLFTVGEWCKTSGIRLNVVNCKVMHFGKSNPKAVYRMIDDVGNKQDIEQTNLERDLGITVDNNLRWSVNVHIMVEKLTGY